MVTFFKRSFTTEILWDGLPVFRKKRKHDVQIHLRWHVVLPKRVDVTMLNTQNKHSNAVTKQTI